MSTQETKWEVDPTHSKIGFKVKHLMISNVTGTFREFEGSISSIGNDFSKSVISLSINSASVDTEIGDRDAHLKSGDFFDVEIFPKITFTGSGLKDLGDDLYELTGDLTINGITNPATLSVEFGGINSDPWGNVKAGFSVTGKIKRKDWGLTWNAALETGGVLVGEEVKINCDIQLVKIAE